MALDLCAQCHGPRNPLFPMLDSEHRFRAGERYEDHFQPLVVVNGGERSGDYFADGRPFEYHGDATKTADSRNAQGWTTLGDVGHVDAEGYLYLVMELIRGRTLSAPTRTFS